MTYTPGPDTPQQPEGETIVISRVPILGPCEIVGELEKVGEGFQPWVSLFWELSIPVEGYDKYTINSKMRILAYRIEAYEDDGKRMYPAMDKAVQVLSMSLSALTSVLRDTATAAMEKAGGKLG